MKKKLTYTALPLLLLMHLVASASTLPTTELLSESFDSIDTTNSGGNNWYYYYQGDEQDTNSGQLTSWSYMGKMGISLGSTPLEAGNGAWAGIKSQEYLLNENFEASLTAHDFAVVAKNEERWYAAWRLRFEEPEYSHDSSTQTGKSRIDLRVHKGYNAETQSEFEFVVLSHFIDGERQKITGGNCKEGYAFCKRVNSGAWGSSNTLSIKRIENTFYGYFNEILIGSLELESSDSFRVNSSVYIENEKAGAITEFETTFDHLQISSIDDIVIDRLSLEKGWQLVDTAVEDGRPLSGIFAGENAGVVTKVLSYRSNCGCQEGWLLTDMEHGIDEIYHMRSHRSYWVYSPDGGEIELRGFPSASTVPSLKEGWNLIARGASSDTAALKKKVRASGVTMKVKELIASCGSATEQSSCAWSSNDGSSTESLTIPQALWIKMEGPQADNSSPTVTLASDKTQLSTAGDVTLTATAADDRGVASVQFYEGGKLLGVDLVAPYRLVLPLNRMDDGGHSYRAQVFDAAGNSRVSDTVSVMVAIGEESETGVAAAKSLVNDMHTWLNTMGREFDQPTTDFEDRVDQVTQLNRSALSLVENSLTVVLDELVNYYKDMGGDNHLLTGSDSPYQYDLSNIASSSYTGAGTLTVIEGEWETTLKIAGQVNGSSVDLGFSYPKEDTVVTTAGLLISGTIIQDNATVTLDGAKVLASWVEPKRLTDSEFGDDPELKQISAGISGKWELKSATESIDFEGEIFLDSALEKISGGDDGDYFVPRTVHLNGVIDDGVDRSRIQATAQFSNADGLTVKSKEQPENYWGVSLKLAAELDLQGIEDAQLSVQLDRSDYRTIDAVTTLSYGQKATQLSFSFSEPEGSNQLQLNKGGIYTFSNGSAVAEVVADNQQVTGTLTVAGEQVGEISDDSTGVGVKYSDGEWEYF